jgi:hypothetical protein
MVPSDDVRLVISDTILLLLWWLAILNIRLGIKNDNLAGLTLQGVLYLFSTWNLDETLISSILLKQLIISSFRLNNIIITAVYKSLEFITFLYSKKLLLVYIFLSNTYINPNTSAITKLVTEKTRTIVKYIMMLNLCFWYCSLWFLFIKRIRTQNVIIMKIMYRTRLTSTTEPRTMSYWCSAFYVLSGSSLNKCRLE